MRFDREGNPKPYRGRLTTALTRYAAIAGILVGIWRISDAKGALDRYFGGGIIVAALILYTLAIISEDIYAKRYMQEREMFEKYKNRKSPDEDE